jgi:proline-specific peptidase
MYANVNGTRLYYETLGSGPPLMLVHGGPGLSDHRSNKGTHAALADQFQLIYFDLRGCGQSAQLPPDQYTHENFARDVEGLRQHLGLGQMALLGRSYGGFIAQEYAVRFQENLTHLILCDTAAWHGYDDIAKQAALAANLPGVDPDRLERLFDGQMRDNDEFREVFVALQPLYFDHADIDRAKERARGLTYFVDTHNACFGRELPKFDVRPKLGDIRVPTLVIVGRHDWITPVAAAEEIASAIPGAELAIFEYSGHSPQVEESDLYLATVRRFLT